MNRSLLLLFSLIVFVLSSATVQAQFRKDNLPAEHEPLSLDTTQSKNISVDQLLPTPTIQTFSSDQSVSYNSNLIHFSNTAKFFLRAGVDILRGGTDKIPLYSFENSWKYPGPTIKYPETASEHELFLERYQRYTFDN